MRARQAERTAVDPEARRRVRNLLLLAGMVTAMLLPIPVALAAIAGAAVGIRVLGRLAGAVSARAAAGAGDAATSAPPVVSLGRDERGGQVTVTERDLAMHGLILGASGSGKTTTLLEILTAQIRRGAPVLAVDLKGDPGFARTLERACRDAGRPLQVWTPDGGARWNPLAHGNATELKDKLIATERFTEPHYKRAAERYLQLALGVLQEARPDRRPTLDDVVEVLEPGMLLRATRALAPDRAARIDAYVASLTRDQLSAVRGLGTRLAIITESPAGPFLRAGGEAGAGGELDLRCALRGEQVALFSLDSSRYGELAGQLGTLAVRDLITAAGARPAGSSLATVAIDEFSALSAGENVVYLFARGRGHGIGMLLTTQELADMDHFGSPVRDQIVGNTNLKLIHRQEVPRSARAAAEMAGTAKAWEHTYSDSGRLLGGAGARGGTRRLVDRFIVEPSVISRFGTGQLVRVSKTPVPRTQVVRVRRSPPQRGAAER